MDVQGFQYPSKLKQFLFKKGWSPMLVSKCTQPCNTLSIVTLNVWFDSIFQQERFKATILTLESLDADIIALQEVTMNFYTLLKSSRVIQGGYIISAMGESWYSVVMLVKRCKYIQLDKFTTTLFATKQDRFLLTAHITTLHSQFTVSTAHFESGIQDWELRKQQLKVSNFTDILVGDFNVYDDLLESQFIASLGWSDAHLILPQPQNEFTFGSFGFKKTEKKRLDRVLFKNFTVKEIQTFGDYTLDIPDFTVYPSDHLGIHCILEFRNEYL
jgi:endonuclease/exonuclease/phosphatase family metal-dependent hydrolase